MILILKPDTDVQGPEFRKLTEFLAALPNIQTRQHQEHGTQQVLTEIYLIGDTASLDAGEMQTLLLKQSRISTHLLLLTLV